MQPMMSALPVNPFPGQSVQHPVLRFSAQTPDEQEPSQASQRSSEGNKPERNKIGKKGLAVAAALLSLGGYIAAEAGGLFRKTLAMRPLGVPIVEAGHVWPGLRSHAFTGRLFFRPGKCETISQGFLSDHLVKQPAEKCVESNMVLVRDDCSHFSLVLSKTLAANKDIMKKIQQSAEHVVPVTIKGYPHLTVPGVMVVTDLEFGDSGKLLEEYTPGQLQMDGKNRIFKI